jgi:segregation and condensation protein A
LIPKRLFPGRDNRSPERLVRFPVNETTPTASPVDESSPLAEPREEGLAGDESVSPLRVDIEQFQGPLDLLLHLIRTQKVNIYDIPIAKITSQYFAHLKQAGQMNIDLGGEFVFMAASLIHIKSKMLLPADPALPEGEEEDPRHELVQQLIEHEKFVQAAQMLREKRLVEENVWTRPADEAFLEDDEEPGLAVGLFDLVKVFEKVLERAKNRPSYEISPEQVSVRSRIEYLKNLLLSADGGISLRDIFERQPSRQALIATFLAVLELVRMQAVVLRQKQLFEEIVIRKHKLFDTVFNNEDVFAGAEYEA